MIEFLCFRLDCTNQCLLRSAPGMPDEKIALTPKAFAVLHYLVEHRARVVSHDELLDAVWPGVHVQPEVIKGHILAIRTALGDTAQESRYIETVRKRGYRFVAPVGNAEAPPPAVSRSEQGAYVGREKPLAELQGLLDQAMRHAPQLVFVTGAAGIGKTALIDRFCDGLAGNPGVCCAAGYCIEGFGGIEPYYPVLEALGRLLKGPHGDAIITALVAAAPTWAVQFPALLPRDVRSSLQQQIGGASRERMLREFCEFVDALTARQTLVLVLEDLHWADFSTVDLISALARRRGRPNLLLIGTYRSRDTDTGHHPLRGLIHELQLKALCKEILLDPLQPGEVREFVTGGAASGELTALARIVGDQSGGNPLFMIAMLDNLVDRDLIARTGSGWKLRVPLGDVRLEVPGQLTHLIEACIRDLDAVQERALEAGSVVGDVFSAAIAARAGHMSLLEFEAVCEALARDEKLIVRGELRTFSDGSIAREFVFKHALFRQGLYRRQGPLRLRESHLLIGEDIERLCSRAEKAEAALQLAQHFAGAQQWTRALDYLREALLTARRRFAYQEALAILDRMTELAANLPGPARLAVEIECLENQAPIYDVSYDPRVEATYARLAQLAAEHGRNDIRMRSLVNLADVLSWHDQTRCQPLLDEALALSVWERDTVTQAYTRIAVHSRKVLTARWSDADARACEQALVLLRQQGEPLVVARAQIEYSMMCMVSTRYREAIGIFRPNYRFVLDSSGEHAEYDLARAIWMKHSGIPCCLLFLGRLGESLAEFDAGIAAFAADGNLPVARALQIYRGFTLLHAMDYAGVIAACTSAPLPAEAGSDPVPIRPMDQRLALVLCGLAAAGQEDDAAARGYFLQAEQDMARRPAMLDWFWRLAMQWGRADLALRSGDRAQAAASVAQFLRMAGETEERTWQALAWETKARLALQAGDTGEAVGHIERGLAVTQGFETPLADWRLHQTAAAVYRAAQDVGRALSHGRLCIAAKQVLADSLPAGHALRTGFERGMGLLRAA